MENVKTFFKTLFWTLLILIVLLSWFRAYMRFLNQDLASTVAGFIYQSEDLVCEECKECEKCDVCDENADCPVCEEAWECDVDEDIASINIMDVVGLEKKVDEVLDLLKWSAWEIISDEIPVEEKTEKELLLEMMERLDKIEG